MATYPHLNELIEEGVRGIREVSRRRMFGGDAYFVGDSIFALVLKSGRIVVRLTETASHDELMAVDEAEPWFVSPTKRMSNWVVVPEGFHDDDEALRLWLRRAIEQNRGAKKVAKKPAGATRRTDAN